MQEWMLAFAENYGYLGIFLLILIENVFPPIPSEAVLLFGGTLTTTTSMTVPVTIIAATLGSVLGAVVLYAFGRVLQAERLKKLLRGRVAKITRLRPEHVDKAEQWFVRYEEKAVLLCRCVPIVRSLISIPAGFAKMKMLRFLLLTALGSAIWNTTLVCVGAGLGTAWESAMPYFDQYSVIAVVVMALLCVAGVGYLWWRSRKKAAAQAKQMQQAENTPEPEPPEQAEQMEPAAAVGQVEQVGTVDVSQDGSATRQPEPVDLDATTPLNKPTEAKHAQAETGASQDSITAQDEVQPEAQVQHTPEETDAQDGKPAVEMCSEK